MKQGNQGKSISTFSTFRKGGAKKNNYMFYFIKKQLITQYNTLANYNLDLFLFFFGIYKVFAQQLQ